jgi:hypothetical protein
MGGTPGGGAAAGLDLDELLGALRSPASGSELLLDDTAPWFQNAQGRWA